MKRIQELTERYSSEGTRQKVLVLHIWDMDESGCFCKALPDKGLVEKGKEAKGGKKFKQRITIAFSVNAAGKKMSQLSYGRVKIHVVSNV